MMKQQSYLPFAFFEGKIIPAELAKVSIMTNALQYGNGIFGGIRGYQSSDRKKFHIFRLNDHYVRFLKSLRILNKTIPYTADRLAKITLELAGPLPTPSITRFPQTCPGRNSILPSI